MTHGRRYDFMAVAILTIVILAVAWMLSALAVAEETVIYKSTDPQGKVSYGDKPADNAAVVEEIRLPGPSTVPPDAAQAQIDDLAATTDRLRADRLDRERERAAAVPPPPAEPPPLEIHPQYRTYPGPWTWPTPFRGRDRHGRHDVPYEWRDDWRDERHDERHDDWHPPQHARPPEHHRHPQQRSLLRNPDR